MAGQFVPDDLDATQWESIEPLANDLLERELNCSSCLEGLIRDASHLAEHISDCLLYTSPSPRDRGRSRMPSCA